MNKKLTACILSILTLKCLSKDIHNCSDWASLDENFAFCSNSAEFLFGNISLFNFDETDFIYIDNLNMHQYVLLGWSALVVILIGLLGNVLTIKILVIPSMINSINIFIASLAVSDFVSLILILFLVPLRYILVSHTSVNFYELHTLLYPYLYPLATTFQFISIYLVCVICASRVTKLYFSSIASKLTNVLCLQIITVVTLFSALSCMPLWFYYEVDYENNSETNSTRLYLKYTTFSVNLNYRFYLHIYLIIITYVIPLLALLVMNYFLVVFIVKTRKRKTSLGIRERNEHMITFMLVLFVIMFFLCQLPNFVLHIFQAVNLKLGTIISQSYIHQWANFLLILNSSYSFALYCALSQKFREEAKNIFSCNRSGSKDQNVYPPLIHSPPHNQNRNTKYTKNTYEMENI